MDLYVYFPGFDMNLCVNEGTLYAFLVLAILVALPGLRGMVRTLAAVIILCGRVLFWFYGPFLRLFYRP